MMDKRTGKARHKHEPPLRLRIRWLAGTAMLLATALLVSLPLTLRTTDNIEQMFDTRATIAYPRLGINLPIRHGADENSLAAGAGHWQGTSLPIGGKGTHAVITAHRGLADKLMFTKLDQARKGDEFTLTTLDETLTYRVESILTT